MNKIPEWLNANENVGMYESWSIACANDDSVFTVTISLGEKKEKEAYNYFDLSGQCSTVGSSDEDDCWFELT